MTKTKKEIFIEPEMMSWNKCSPVNSRTKEEQEFIDNSIKYLAKLKDSKKVSQ
jgi:hypothetical protein